MEGGSYFECWMFTLIAFLFFNLYIISSFENKELRLLRNYEV